MRQIEKNKIIVTLLAVWAISIFSANVYGKESLETLILERKWQELPAIFLDDSHRVLKNYFSTSRSVKIITSRANQLTYKAKFSHQGEIGVITFEKKKGENRYFNLKIKNQIRPLYFIEKFKKYKVLNLRLTVGDARLTFVKGHFYETIPFGSLLIFKGKWQFSIKPNDREEQLTLKRKFRKDFFSKSTKTGIFILPETDFLEGLPSDGETAVLDKETQSLYNMYRDTYGIHIKQFDEYWFLPFPRETHLILFKKDKKSFYYYSYNSDLVPDTRLAVSDNNNIILSYNARKGLKLSFGLGETVSRVNLNLFFNPATNYISGTTTIIYKNPSSLRQLLLAPGLKLVANLNLESKGLNIFRKKDKYYLLGSESKKLSLYFNGHIKPTRENFELFNPREKPHKIQADKADAFYFLSRGDNYYPNPGSEFFETQVTVTIPGALNCLASGHLTEKTLNIEKSNIFKFNSVNSKGISLVTGNFKPGKKLEAGPIPIHFYTPESYNLPKDLDLEEIGKAVHLFSRTFGPLNLPVINILVRPGEQEGGVSNNGFIVVNVPPPRGQLLSSTSLTNSLLEKKIASPILIRNRVEDHILHELAHQWWGGVISWDSYHDLWLTEGLAHFSVLYYLKKNISERKFNRLIRRLKRWVYRFSDSGPIIYGTRINLLEKNYEAYQSVIYNKSALVFLMLLDLIGEEDFINRLKSVVKHFKYKSVSSPQFIRQFCNKNSMLLKFFRKWIYSRAIPVVQLELVKDDPGNDTEEFKRVVIVIKQLDTDANTPFIFPLKLEVVAQEGTSVESIIMKEMEQKYTISRNSTIRTIDIHASNSIALVKEKRLPAFNSKR